MDISNIMDKPKSLISLRPISQPKTAPDTATALGGWAALRRSRCEWRECANNGHSLTLIAAVENDCVDGSPEGGPWLELKLGDRDCLRSSISPQRLRRHAEGPQEGTTHAFAVRKTRFLRDQFYRVPASLHHEPGSF